MFLTKIKQAGMARAKLEPKDRNDFYLSEKQEVVSLLPAELIEWGFVSSFSVPRDI